MRLLALFPENTPPLFQALYQAIRDPEKAGSAAASLGLLKAPIQASAERLKQRGRVGEANRLKHEFRRLLHALNRLENHFAGLAQEEPPLMGEEEAYIYTCFAEQRYDALLAYVADLDGRQLH